VTFVKHAHFCMTFGKHVHFCMTFEIHVQICMTFAGIGKAMRNWRFQVDCGALRSVICAPCKFWLIILLFHVSIKVVFYFVSWFCHCLHSSLISL
jgi:hypothetical protein